MKTRWFRDVEVAGRRCDVEVGDGRVVAVHQAGTRPPRGVDEVVDGQGGALLPGLHDHHVHLLSLAAAMNSVDCAGITDLAGLGAALRSDAHPDGWVRAIGHDEAGTGPLDRHVLDGLVPDRPVRVQHRGGALWVLNSKALAQVAGVLDDSPDVERAADGAPTGRLWRYDARLAPALPRRSPDLAAVGAELRALGITGVTDATPDLDEDAMRLLGLAVESGELPLRVTVLATAADPGLSARYPGLRMGPAKLLLRDHDLPSLPELAAAVRRHHEVARPVAVHCVSAESLVLTLAALDEVGVLAGDRIEHAAVVPAGLEPELARLGIRVVTQPGFLSARGERYRAEVATSDLPFLYPVARLLAAGVPTVCSSDAPFGPLDPWRVIAAARDRTTEQGNVLGPEERISAQVALSGYLTPPESPGGTVRELRAGAVADLVLLGAPLGEVLARPDRSWVRATFLATGSGPDPTQRI